jgi:hypothetical protein
MHEIRKFTYPTLKLHAFQAHAVRAYKIKVFCGQTTKEEGR